MSGITLQDLLAFDPEPWHTASDVWHKLALGIDDTSDQLTSGTRDLGEIWPRGTGSAAAMDKANTLRSGVNNAYPPAKRLADALDQHAYAMKGLRSLAESVVASARQAGYTVDTAAGTITAPASAYMGGNLDHTGRETAQLLNELRQVVAQAQAQDESAAAIIKGNVPSDPSGLAAAPPAGHARAEDLAKKIKNPNYHPTAAELEELRNLFKEYGKDKDFAYNLLTDLGPKGLLELNGQLALYQNDKVGKDADGFSFNGATADVIKDLQLGLGGMLDSATEPTGIKTGPRGENYTPGQYELSSQWVEELKAAGRSQMDVGDPSSPGRYLHDVYGYQLLGPLLRGGDFDAGFLSNVGGDIVDFEMQQGKDGRLWTEARGEDIRLDWTQDHNDDKAPAGYDPVTPLMDALSRNGDAARDLLNGVTTYSSGGPADGRLPRLDYLLTDRDWNAAKDIPGGAAWTGELIAHRDDFKNPSLDKFGDALVQATTTQEGPESRRLVEAIIYETNADEQAKGYENRETPGQDGKTADLRATNFIQPELRDSMGTVMGAYIDDVNHNLADERPVNDAKHLNVNREDLVRFLADVGKDDAGREAVAEAERGYATENYADIISGRRDPDASVDANIGGMETVSNQYGRVMGALDLGRTEADIQAGFEADKKVNDSLETKYRIAGPLVEGVVGLATDRVPGAGDVLNAAIGDAMDKAQEDGKADNQGNTAFNAGNLLGDGRTAAVTITEAAIYGSGQIPVPEALLVDGQLKPMEQWTGEDARVWNEFKKGLGTDTVGQAAVHAGNLYQSGYESAAALLSTKRPTQD